MTNFSDPESEVNEGVVLPDCTSDEPGPVAVRRFRNAPQATAGLLLALVALAVLYSMRDHWQYFLESDTPEELGRVEEAVAKGRLRHNAHVTFTARPLHEAEGRYVAQDPAPGCFTGPKRTMYYTLLAETGDRVVLRTAQSLKARQQIPRRERLTGRLLRLDRLPDTFRMYKRFLFRLTDCRSQPTECNRQLLLGADLPREAFLGQIGKSEARIRSAEGHGVKLTPQTPVFLLFQYPDEWEYELAGLTKEEAAERVKALGVPWVYVESRKGDHLFVIRPPRALAQKLVKEQRRGKGYGISQRGASFLVTFGQVGRRGDTLILRGVGTGFPEEYRTKPSAQEGAPPTLEATAPSGLVRVPLARFVKASYHGPRILPDDGFLLLDGLRPRMAWVAFVLGIVAASVILLGLVLVALGLRRPRSGA